MSDIDTHNPPAAAPKAKPSLLIWKVAVLCVTIGLGYWVWDEFIEERVIPKRLGVVVPKQLYRSGQLHPALVEDVLRVRGIDLVIDMTRQVEGDPYQEAEQQAVENLNIEHLRLPGLGGDGLGDPNRYIEALIAIDQAMDADQQVLVHCAAGSQRTGGVVALYRLLFEQWETDRIIDEMKQYDWEMTDQVLLDYLDKHLPEIAAALAEAGVIDRVPENLPRLAP